MNIEIICVGKLKEKYLREAAAEYSKRLSKFCRLQVTELPETRLESETPAAEQAVVLAESEAIARKIKRGPDCFTVALDVRGRELSSEELASELASLQLSGKSRVSFLIGGSLGMSEELMRSCDLRLSFSRMTFPHQLMRVIMLEQIYRAFKINAGEKYHK
ncbi:MAG: 23S rRNA (pseudouridine(1915)-N(3))-methyltransferase RlmH [Firmicutes bacterium]|nr:23S rRNA (pseudouridine(1915)-N(3))-methyltransferase RlmH [Bacillota bacterium]